MSRALGVLTAVVLVAGCGGTPPAPAPGTLPLAPQARVIASAAGGSQVDPAQDHNRYRYMALTGPPRTPGARLIAAQVRSMLARGWDKERSIAIRGTGSAPQAVPVTSVGAEVLLDSPHGRDYAAIQLLAPGAGANAQTDGSPLWHDPAIAGALAHRQPVLWVVLGHGMHS